MFMRHNGIFIIRKPQEWKIIIRYCFVTLALFTYSTIEAQITYKEAFPNLRFDHPVELQFPNDGTNRVFVLEQEGLIKVFPNLENTNSLDIDTFLDITDRVQYSYGQEIGLLGLAFHPNFINNRYFYVYYTSIYSNSGASRSVVLSRFTVDSNNANKVDPNSELIIFQFDKNQSTSNHNGGKIAFGPDNYLYISFGDGGGGGDPNNNAQNINNVFGSICRIDVDLDGSNPIENNSSTPDGNYEIPDTNPLVGSPGLDEIYAYGIRNTWKFSFDNITGRLWGADVGQGAYEEINLIENGGNYGWSRFEANTVANSNVTINEATKFPIFYYNHNQGDVSITGGYVYRGSEITSTNPSILSQYIFGDFVSGRVWSLDYNESTSVVSTTLLFKANGRSISTFGRDTDGELFFSDYRGDARIYKLIDGITPASGIPIDGAGSWSSLDSGTNGLVQTLATDDEGNVYHGGSFSQAGDIVANNIALWNESFGWKVFGSGSNGTINALKIDSNGNLYAGGSFSEIDGISANNIAVWNGVQWSALGSGIDGVVYALETDINNNLFVGGIFEKVNGINARNIAFWNGGQWSVLTDITTQNTGTNNEIRSLAFDENDILYVGGNFDEAGGKTANRIATWDGSNWGTLGSGTSGFVQAIVATSTDVYIGGNFAMVDNKIVNRIAKWNKDSSSWSTLGNGLNNNVNALIHDGNYLYAGGSFDIAYNNEADGVIVNNIARWSDDNKWEALGTLKEVGVDIKLNALVFSSESMQKIFAGGNFTKAGSIDANNIALWNSSISLDVSDYNKIKKVNVFPNPTSGIVHLTEENDWILVNTLGITIYKDKGKRLDISNLNAGIYFLKIANGSSFKIIKN